MDEKLYSLKYSKHFFGDKKIKEAATKKKNFKKKTFFSFPQIFYYNSPIFWKIL